MIKVFCYEISCYVTYLQKSRTEISHTASFIPLHMKKYIKHETFFKSASRIFTFNALWQIKL